MRSWVLGILAAVFLHLLILLFGGIFFLGKDDGKSRESVEEVQILEVAEESQDEKSVEPEETVEVEETAPIEEPQEEMPDMRQLFEEQPVGPSADAGPPALAALSLSALEGALGPGGSGGDAFGMGFNLASGGRIGGVGAPGKELAEEMVFSLSELDVKPRVLFQSPPSYPSELRHKKVEGLVQVLFVVDTEGRVTDPKIEASSRPEFEAPALEAVRRWKFEPAMRGGKKVSSRMRVPIRFAVTG